MNVCIRVVHLRRRSSFYIFPEKKIENFRIHSHVHKCRSSLSRINVLDAQMGKLIRIRFLLFYLFLSVFLFLPPFLSLSLSHTHTHISLVHIERIFHINGDPFPQTDIGVLSFFHKLFLQSKLGIESSQAYSSTLLKSALSLCVYLTILFYDSQPFFSSSFSYTSLLTFFLSFLLYLLLFCSKVSTVKVKVPNAIYMRRVG